MRVLGVHNLGGMTLEDAQHILRSERFLDSIFITECNKPVCLYAMTRARHFSQQRGQQLLWIQAEDTPPQEHFAHYTREELVTLKKKWLSPTYHAKKTDGILSLCPSAYGLPIRITSGMGTDCKACGVHNGMRGFIRGWELQTDDSKTLIDNVDREVVLQKLPTILWIESLENLKKQHPKAPHKNWFPLRPISNSWTLDADEHIEITRKGFAVVPDFSSTIHVATGRSIKACLPDLGGIGEPASPAAMMRGFQY